MRGGRGRAARAKAAARVAKSAARAKGRRAAAATLAALAADVGAPPVKRRRLVLADVEALIRRLDRMCHTPELSARLRAATEAWVSHGGPLAAEIVPEPEGSAPLPRHKILKPEFRLRSDAFMLTYNGRNLTRGMWQAFRTFIANFATTARAAAWAACLELTPTAAGGAAEVVHLHAYFLWTDSVGFQARNLDAFRFEDRRPRVDVCKGRAMQGRYRAAALHGLWYVSVVKTGTLEAASNLAVFSDYEPRAAWLVGLWNQHKVSHHRFLELSRQFRTGHAGRKRDVVAVLQDEREAAVNAHLDTQRQRQEAAGLARPFRPNATVDAFVALFDGRVLHRRPVLAIVGATNMGKSHLAADVLRRVGRHLGLHSYTEVTVEEDETLDFQDFVVERDAGVLLDGVGDVLVLKRHREMLQGRAKRCYGARSATMVYSYPFTLAERAVVATFDLSAANLDLLATDHWLQDERNVLVVRLDCPAFLAPGE